MKEQYETPVVEIEEVNIERGYFGSDGSGVEVSETQYDPYGRIL